MKKRKVVRKIKKSIFLTIFLVVFLGLLFKAYSCLKPSKLYISPLGTAKEKGKSKDVRKSLEEMLSNSNIPFSSVETASDSSFLIYSDNSQIFLSSKKPLAEQISSLQLILSRLTIEGKRFTTLDLRFDKPVVNFK